ncbi:MAG: pentapeptide repeat-containing protein [Desulfoprunum sp.]|nr:pentapeptide repeat-containing protein [Desulfoprunum sp.]
MLTRKTTICILSALLLLAACAPGNQNRLLKEGKAPLSAKQIFQLVSGNTLHLESIDFNARVHFQANGRMSAKTRLNSKDTGAWDINNDKQLCLKFKSLYYGDQKCYGLVESTKDTYIFFTTNGARAYSATRISGDPDKLAVADNKAGKTYLRETLAGGKPAAETGDTAAAPTSSPSAATMPQQIASPAVSPEEARHTLVEMAKNCPNCNLAGADLKGADLITANLAGANLAGADLSHANLRRANLAGANLAGAIMINSNMPGANLAGCNMSNADLTGANLIKANFTGAMTEGIQLQNAHLEGVTGLTK